jgi:molecular chaperone DnaJ
MAKDLYKILGITKEADDKEIKKAYRKMAMKYHPDKNAGDKEAETKFKDVAEAYEILSDGDKKARYDSMGYDAYANGGQRGQQGDPFGFSDIFNSMRQQQQGNRRKQQHSIIQKITLSMEDIYNGVTKKFKYNRLSKCEPCNGKGGEDVERCKTCDGKGIQLKIQRTEFGVVQQAISCNDCDGRGFKISKPCTTCHGKMFTQQVNVIEIKIPHSTMPNEQIHYSNKGHEYIDETGQNAGDLILVIDVNQEKSTILKDFGLLSKIDLPYEIMILGGEYEFKTIDGTKVKVTISKLTNIGRKLKLKGKGLKYKGYDVMRGDQYLMVDLKFPESITEEEEKLLTEIKKIKE